MLVKIYFVFFLTASIAIAQSNDFGSIKNIKMQGIDSLSTSKATHIETKRLLLVGIGLAVANLGIYQPFKNVWWQEERAGFHLYRGYRRTMGYWDFGWYDSLYGHMDKLGHFYASKLMSEIFTDLSRWVGFNSNSSNVVGPVISFLLMLEIEIYDSFFKEWGFSLADLTANGLGAFSPLIGSKLPFLNRFKLKLSYHPTGQYQTEKNYIKDYVGMTFWLSYDINSDLPQKVEQYWPDFLNVAIGYSMDRPYHGDVELYFAPDINWTGISNRKHGLLKSFFKYLDYVHFPCFAWKFTPRSEFYLLYF